MRTHDRAGVARRLRISLTDHCNYACFFCHNEGQGPVNRSAVQSLSVADLETILAGAALCLVSFVITLMTPEPARWLAERKPPP